MTSPSLIPETGRKMPIFRVSVRCRASMTVTGTEQLSGMYTPHSCPAAPESTVCCSPPQGTWSSSSDGQCEFRAQLPAGGQLCPPTQGHGPASVGTGTPASPSWASEGGWGTERQIHQPKATQRLLHPFGCEDLAPGLQKRAESAARSLCRPAACLLPSPSKKQKLK